KPTKTGCPFKSHMSNAPPQTGRVQETPTSLINTPIHRGVGRGVCVLTLFKGFHRPANRFRAFLNSPCPFKSQMSNFPPQSPVPIQQKSAGCIGPIGPRLDFAKSTAQKQ